MQIIYSVIVVIVSLFAGYYIAQKFLIRKQNRIIQKARINRISLQQIGKVWSPELLIAYYFIFENKVYSGEDYVRIDQLLPDSQLLLIDRHGYPILKTELGEFIGEEHIETFVMENNNEILVEFNSYDLPTSKIFQSNRDKNNKTLFQNIDIKFPWM